MRLGGDSHTIQILHRDAVNKKVMADPRLAAWMDPKKLPFDGKRMFFGGFKIFVDG